MKFLLALTTTPGAHWQKKIAEIEKLRLKEVALFPTCLNLDERKKLYSLLEKTTVVSIPFAHLRNDALEWEMRYLIERFGCKVFNIHADDQAQDFLDRCSKYRNLVYVENGEHYQINGHFKNILDQTAGLCIDFSHWEDFGVRQGYENYRDFKKYTERYPIGCAHISAIKENGFEGQDLNGDKNKFYSCHHLNELSELYYIKNYLDYLPEYCAIEIDNSFEEQLEAKQYLEELVEANK